MTAVRLPAGRGPLRFGECRFFTCSGVRVTVYDKAADHGDEADTTRSRWSPAGRPPTESSAFTGVPDRGRTWPSFAALPRQLTAGKSPWQERRAGFGVSGADRVAGFRCCDLGRVSGRSGRGRGPAGDAGRVSVRYVVGFADDDPGVGCRRSRAVRHRQGPYDHRTRNHRTVLREPGTRRPWLSGKPRGSTWQRRSAGRVGREAARRRYLRRSALGAGGVVGCVERDDGRRHG